MAGGSQVATDRRRWNSGVASPGPWYCGVLNAEMPWAIQSITVPWLCSLCLVSHTCAGAQGQWASLATAGAPCSMTPQIPTTAHDAARDAASAHIFVACPGASSALLGVRQGTPSAPPGSAGKARLRPSPQAAFSHGPFPLFQRQPRARHRQHRMGSPRASGAIPHLGRQ